MTNTGRLQGEDSVQESREALVASEIDLQPPHLRSGLVLRKDLVELLSTTDFDVITITAPAGYGKTTLLAQWANLEKRPVAWVNLRRSDNDVRNLLFHIATSFSRIGAIGKEQVAAFRFTGGAGAISQGTARLVRALSVRDVPVSLVLDHAEVIRSRTSSDAIAELTHRLEGRGRIVVATRSKARLPAAVLRSRGRLLELNVEELAMTPEETRQLVKSVGLSPDTHAPTIDESSGGWPVAAYLIAMAIKSGIPEGHLPKVGGNDRFLSEYVDAEILSHLSASRHQFLKEVSPLERMTGSLCDAVTTSEHSSRSLKAIVESTHLIHPLDRTETWYSMNRVVREALYARLVREEPDTARLIHARAAQWYEDKGMPEQAVHHARMAGDVERFSRLIAQMTRIGYAVGGAPGVLDWMSWFEAEVPLDEYPEVAAVGSLVHAIEGNGLDAERWMEATESASRGRQAHPVVRLVRALGTRAGTSRMIEETQAARSNLPPGSEWIPAALLIEGLANVWNEEYDSADPLLEEAASLGKGIQAFLVSTLASGERGLIALHRGDWSRASTLSNSAVQLVEENGLESYATSGIALVVAARCARRRNDIPKAKSILARAASVRPHLTSTIPGLAVQTLLEMATAHIELSDVVGARVLLTEASDIVIQRQDLGVLPKRLTEMKESIRNLGPGTIGPSSLTNSELRLLPLLATHLTFPEIGERLFISRHTVKTEAMSIYRKLGASSRSEAMAKAVEFGLLTT